MLYITLPKIYSITKDLIIQTIQEYERLSCGTLLIKIDQSSEFSVFDVFLNILNRFFYTIYNLLLILHIKIKIKFCN